MNEIKKINPKKKKKNITNKVGRPKTELNLDEIEKLCRLNCTMPEIAYYFDIPLRTLEDKYTNDQQVRQSIDRGRAHGMLSLRRKQIQIMDENNNATMAIWLGKQILGQKDRQEIISDINIEEKKVIDITRLTDDDLNTIERVLEHSVIESSEGREEQEESEGVYQKLVEHD